MDNLVLDLLYFYLIFIEILEEIIKNYIIWVFLVVSGYIVRIKVIFRLFEIELDL